MHIIFTSKIYKVLLVTKQCFRWLNTRDTPVVTVSEGKLRGAVNQLLDGTHYYSFKGVRYAQAPVDKLRFKAPLPPNPWEGVYEANKHGPVCPQIDMFTSKIIEGKEDCLFLNIYTKLLKPNAKTPVIVFIHGGAFMSGSGNSDEVGPEIILQHDVMLITINYRLEVLGFLSLDTPEVPGNAGMKDQVAALCWIQKNIAKFGGDPDNVTIFGESAGSASVTYHMLSPMSRGLFHKAIAQSGVCIHDWAITHNAKERAFKVGKLLGKETNDVNELLDFLQSVPAISLAQMSIKTRSYDESYRGLPINFVPVIEKNFHGNEAFLTRDPTELLLNQETNSVPLVIGYNSCEGMLMAANQEKKSDFYNKNPSYFIPRDIAQAVSKDKLIEFGERVKEFYYNGQDFTAKDSLNNMNVQADIHFLYNIHRFADFYYKSGASIYFNVFDYDTELNILKRTFNFSKCKGTSHAEDLFYTFHGKLNKNVLKKHGKLRQITFQVSKLWADFAKTGNPTPDNKWPQYTKTNKEFFNINESWSPGKFADKDRVEFWNKLYCDAGLPYIRHSGQE